MTELQLTLSPEEAANDYAIRQRAAQMLHCHVSDIAQLQVVKKSIDALIRCHPYRAVTVVG